MTIVWNEAVLEGFLRGPNGPIARDIAKRTIRVETAAKLNLNTSFPPPSAPGESPHKRTARLQTSVTWRLGEDELGVYGEVGTDVTYGRYLEEGTPRMAARPWLRKSLAAAVG